MRYFTTIKRLIAVRNKRILSASKFILLFSFAVFNLQASQVNEPKQQIVSASANEEHREEGHDSEEHGEEGHDSDEEHGEEHEGEEHGNEAGHVDKEEHEPGLVELNVNSDKLFKIRTEKTQLKTISKEITAPGEVVLNAYKTAIVSLRIDGQVIKRLVKMGDHVVKGQAVAEISSIRMADAQQAYIVDSKEWFRVKKLGKNVVSGKRFIEARSSWQSSKARLLALGLDQKQLESLEENGAPDGIFKMISPIAGVVFSDDFIEGQYIQAGGQLFVISDESKIWVEVAVSPSQASLFSAGDIAEVDHDGEIHQGKIIQVSHLVSETTRTQKIRIEVNNKDDDLHPGQFVSSRLKQKLTEQKLAVPESALVRTADGDWGVFVEVKPRHFKQLEVELIRRQGDLMVISGVEIGESVVIEGAFYLSAELAKSGFDPHGH
ncbi:MAG: efflux transporter periplasmic adaptor subunit [Gammaproteobacteria bacterium]|nr:MAG: efflux transporter periplasmic adaptor subunit [Gammaproteobacteria bacterium]